jgi:PIN domain nuclease of toxin-antitoxin system
LSPRFLLDTNVVIRWLFEPRKLSKEQTRVLAGAEDSGEPVAVSAISLLEVVAALESGRVKARLQDIFEVLGSSSLFQILPLTIEIATEVALLGPSLRDPADRAIVATARVHRLRLLTSDQRIVESRLVAVID